MRNFSLAAIVTLALAACGGGGGDSGPGSGPQAGPLALSGANYVTASQEAISSAFYLQDTGSLLTGAQLTSDRVLINAVMAQLYRMNHWLAHAPKVVTGVTQTQTESCAGGGSLTATADDLNGNDDADAGDSVRLVAAGCLIDGVSVDGVLSAVFNSVSGSFGSTVYSANVTVTLENFAAASSAGNATGNGRLDLALSSSGVNSGSVTVTAANISTLSNYGGVRSTRTLTDFTVRVVISPSGSGALTSTTVNGTLSSTALESKSITISTLGPFVKSSSARYPGSGQLVVTGAANSKARLTVLSTTTVQIELDADGNGSYETSTTMPWSQLV